jgi:hypothetical protein
MKAKHVYWILAAIGFLVPYAFFVAFLAGHGLDGKAFLQQLFGTRISTFFAADLILASIVFVRFLRGEAARMGLAPAWPYLVALLAVGLSFALPLFLAARETRIEEAAPGASR